MIIQYLTILKDGTKFVFHKYQAFITILTNALVGVKKNAIHILLLPYFFPLQPND